MKNIFYFFTTISLLTTPGLLAQPVPAERTEVVIPNAFSFYDGKGAGYIQFCDSLNGISFLPNTPYYGITTDGGETWRDGRPSTQIDPILRMYLVGKDSIVAIRDSQYIFHSFNAGETWTLAASLWTGELINKSFFFNHKHAINLTTGNELMISSDLGVSWITTSWQYRAIKPGIFYNNGYLFVTEVQQYPNPPAIVYSTNNGMTWQKIDLPSSIGDYTYIARGNESFVIGTNNGIVYSISETGQILKKLNSPGNALARGYTYVSDSEILSIDNNNSYYSAGVAKYSIADSTTSYIPLSYSEYSLDQIAVTTHDKIVMGSTSGPGLAAVMVFHRNGFSDIRVERYKLPGNVDASSLFFVNDAKGFAATSKNLILKTSDGGQSWQETTVPAQLALITGFARKSETEFIAICEGGGILESNDDGATWQAVPSAFQGSIIRAAFAGRDTIFFCTKDSLYMTTPSWQQITRVNTGLSGGYFLDLDFYDGFNGAATYQKNSDLLGRVFVTTDRGTTWQLQNFPNRLFTYDPGSQGLMYISAKGFGTWYEGSSGRIVYMSNYPSFVDQNRGGVIALSSGNQDVFFNLGTRGNFRHINLGSNIFRKQIVAAGENSVYLLSNDGQFWKFSHSSTLAVPTSVLRNSPVDGSPYEFHNLTFKWQEPWTVAPVTQYHFQLALGDTSNIVENRTGLDSTSLTVNLTADSALYFWRVRAENRYGWGSFNQWYSFMSSTVALEPRLYTTPLRGDLTAAIILPGGRLIVANNYGEMARTDNLPGGWTTVASQTVYPINRFYYDTNNNLTFYLTNGNFLGYSSNKGFSFGRKEAPFGSTMITSIAPLAPNLLFASGWYGSLFKAVGGITSWTNVWFAPSAGDFRHINTDGTSKIAAVGDFGNITLSHDGGQTFRYIAHSQLEMYKRVGFAPDGTVVVLNRTGERRTTTDMGDTWNFELFEIRKPIRAMITQNGISVVIDTLGGVYTSLSPASPWRYTKLPAGVAPMGVEISGETILITARGNKLFIVPLYSGNPVSVKDETDIQGFSLGSNYPNPFNASTLIEYSIADPGNYTLEVFNTMGEKVASLHEGWLDKGNYRQHFSPGNLASGIYLYRLSGKGLAVTHKMIIMK